MRFRYVVQQPGGELVRGILEAESEPRAEQVLWDNNYTVVSLRRERQLPKLHEALPTFFGVRPGDLVVLARQLANLLSAGISLVPALRMVGQQFERAAVRDILGRVSGEVQQGETFSTALSHYPLAFPPLFVRLVAVGEATGQLQDLLVRAADYIERQQAVAQKIKGALLYPAIVLSVAGIAVYVLITFAIPAISTLFKEFGGQLPLVTRILLAVVDFANKNGLLVLGLLALIAFGIGWYGRTPRGARNLTALLMHLPAVGPLLVKGAVSQIARTMATLYAAGINVTETLDLLIQTVGNPVLREGLLQVRSRVLAGTPLSESIASYPAFPAMFYQVVAIGEQSGALDENLSRLAHFLEDETDRAAATLTSLIEPALVIFVGLVVGVIAVSIISPIYALTRTIR